MINNTTNITNINNILGDTYYQNGKLTTEGEKALTTNSATGRDIIKNTAIIQAINNINNQGTKFFHVNSEKNVDGDAIKSDPKDSSAGSRGSIAIGMMAEAGNKAENVIAIGTGNIVKGENSGAIGDPSVVNAKNSYLVGNDGLIGAKEDGTDANGNKKYREALQGADGKEIKDVFAFGNKIKNVVANSVFLGSESSYVEKGDSTKGTDNSYTSDVVISVKNANGEDIKVEKKFAGGSEIVGVVSVGGGVENGKIQTRRIQNVAPV